MATASERTTYSLLYEEKLDGLALALKADLQKKSQTSQIAKIPLEMSDGQLRTILDMFQCKVIAILVSPSNRSSKKFKDFRERLLKLTKSKVLDIMVLDNKSRHAVLKLLMKDGCVDDSGLDVSLGTEDQPLTDTGNQSPSSEGAATPDAKSSETDSLLESGFSSLSSQQKTPKIEIEDNLKKGGVDGLLAASEAFSKQIQIFIISMKEGDKEQKLKEAKEFLSIVNHFLELIKYTDGFEAETVDKLQEDECEALVQLRREKERIEAQWIEKSQDITNALHGLSTTITQNGAVATSGERVTMIDAMRQMEQLVQQLKQGLENEDAMEVETADMLFD